MACVCEKCSKPVACGEKYCDQCFIDKLQTDTEKNLYSGGQFYPCVQNEDNRLKPIPTVTISGRKDPVGHVDL